MATKFLDRPAVVYPESDGKRIAENTLQFRWIVTIQGNLDLLYRDRPEVFVAGDHLWYPVEGEPEIRQAPEVYVAFGRPKGDRGSYRQWVEGGVAPQVEFEVLAPSNYGRICLRNTSSTNSTAWRSITSTTRTSAT